MHQAIELLLKRMESHPEEFVRSHPRHTRWNAIIHRYDPYMDSSDRDAIQEKYRKIQMDHMLEEIMSELLYGEVNRGNTNYED